MILADAWPGATQFRGGLQKLLSKGQFSRLRHSMGVRAALLPRKDLFNERRPPLLWASCNES